MPRKEQKLKIVFNDLSELQIQSAAVVDGYLQIKTISATSADLKTKFLDPFAVKTMKIVERGQTIAEYAGYTVLYRLEEYAGGILGVAMYKQQETPEVQAEIQAAAIEVARLQAQTLTDAQALSVKAIYPVWAECIGMTVDKGFKFVYEDVLYKTIQDKLLIQEQYVPGEGTESLYTVIDETHAGTLADPIPYNGNMELLNGKYYSQDGITYLCNRDTGQAVFQDLSDLVGIYVTVA